MGLVQRCLEEAGFCTVGLSNLKNYTRRVRPPRTLVVPPPRGETAGPAGDGDEQMRRVGAALQLMVTRQEPGTIVE